MSKHGIIPRIIHPGIIAIIRSDGPEGIIDAAMAFYQGGIRAVEISLTTPGALETIKAVRVILPEGCLIGAGTVLDAETARMAILAGAEFAVSPVLNVEMVRMCNRYGIPTVCGAYTPAEALAVHECGGDFVKIFPAADLGPRYVRELLAPMPQLALIPTGGVTLDHCGEYLAAGATAVAIGASVVNKQVLAQRNWSQITERARAYVEAALKAKGLS